MNESVHDIGLPLLCIWHELLADTSLTTPPTKSVAKHHAAVAFPQQGELFHNKSTSVAVLKEKLFV